MGIESAQFLKKDLALILFELSMSNADKGEIDYTNVC